MKASRHFIACVHCGVKTLSDSLFFFFLFFLLFSCYDAVSILHLLLLLPLFLLPRLPKQLCVPDSGGGRIPDRGSQSLLCWLPPRPGARDAPAGSSSSVVPCRISRTTDLVPLKRVRHLKGSSIVLEKAVAGAQRCHRRMCRIAACPTNSSARSGVLDVVRIVRPTRPCVHTKTIVMPRRAAAAARCARSTRNKCTLLCTVVAVDTIGARRAV